MAKRKKIPKYKEIASAIVRMKTIDISKDDGGYPTIHWMIASEMLDNSSDYDRARLLSSYAGMVKRNFSYSLSYLIEECCTPVYVFKDEGKNGRNTACVTTDKEYMNAYELNYRRTRRH